MRLLGFVSGAFGVAGVWGWFELIPTTVGFFPVVALLAISAFAFDRADYIHRKARENLFDEIERLRREEKENRNDRLY